jgi:hypothetical protein
LVLGRHCKSGTTASTEAIRCFLLLHQLVAVAAVNPRPQLVVLAVALVKVLLVQMALLVRATRVATVVLVVLAVAVAVVAVQVPLAQMLSLAMVETVVQVSHRLLLAHLSLVVVAAAEVDKVP